MVLHDTWLTPLQREIINGLGYREIVDTPDGGVTISRLAALELSDIAEHGIENACPNEYLYERQTWAFFAAHRQAIIAMLAEQAEEGMYGDGVTTALGAVTRFSCFDGWDGGKEALVETAAQVFYLPIEEAEKVDGALYLVQMIVWGLIEDTANAMDWYQVTQGKEPADAMTA